MKTTNYYNITNKPTSKELFISRKVTEYATTGNPYHLAYWITESTIRFLLGKQWSEPLERTYKSLYHAYKNLLNGQPNDDTATDLIQAVAVNLLENGSADLAAVRSRLRVEITNLSQRWNDTSTSYYEDIDGEVHRLPEALTCAIDGCGRACTVSSWNAVEVARALESLPLTEKERQALIKSLSGSKLTNAERQALKLAKGKARATLAR